MSSRWTASCMETKCGVKFDLSKESAELNQYWYSPQTIDALLSEVCHHATACAFLSTPSLYFALLSKSDNSDCRGSDCDYAPRLCSDSRLFEFDRQWEKCPGFVHYDFRKPEHVPVQYFAAFDYVLADPPFITESVWAAYIETTKLLLRPGGKMLFTTILENHTMLEGLLDAPLFIAPFCPAIVNLTYQYVCFTNYRATRITQPNSELPPCDPEIVAAVQTANDLRESEQEFVAQMRRRNRDGEQPLPTECHKTAPGVAVAGELSVSAMKWRYVPPGLTMYAGNGEGPPVENDNNDEDYGDAYRDVETLRRMLEEFKQRIDRLQRHLDMLLKLQQRRSKSGESAETSAADAAILTAREQFAATLEEMCGIIKGVVAIDERVTASGGPVGVNHILAMKDCVEVYAAVPLRKQDLSELAADATRKYKSPVFNRMKELLQWMKEIKKEKKGKEMAVTDNAARDDYGQ